MIVCEEMQKLRTWLDENKIPWEDVSEDICRFKLNKTEHEMWICRTHFNIKGHKVSVINGYGTYGGYGIISEENEGLLETMGLWNGEESVKGYLTAEEVINKTKALIRYMEET